VPDAPATLKVPKPDTSEKPIYLISYPKIILLYPTFFMAIIAGIIANMVDEKTATASMVGWIFMWVFTLNIVVLAFDFPRTTSLTLFFLLMAFGLGVTLLSTYNPELLPGVYAVLKRVNPYANPTFYFMFAGIFGIIYIFVFILIRFDYWELRSNELLHHHGFLSSLERFPASNLRITKEVDDVFEYILLGSGRLVIQPTNVPRAFVLDNVPFITSKEARITRTLGALQVQVRTENVAGAADDHI
jgi:Zn-dependent protease with chaperone function